jgi:hypothetical protein
MTKVYAVTIIEGCDSCSVYTIGIFSTKRKAISFIETKHKFKSKKYTIEEFDLDKVNVQWIKYDLA